MKAKEEGPAPDGVGPALKVPHTASKPVGNFQERKDRCRSSEQDTTFVGFVQASSGCKEVAP
jgi:hypothetical protein